MSLSDTKCLNHRGPPPEGVRTVAPWYSLKDKNGDTVIWSYALVALNRWVTTNCVQCVAVWDNATDVVTIDVRDAGESPNNIVTKEIFVGVDTFLIQFKDIENTVYTEYRSQRDREQEIFQQGYQFGLIHMERRAQTTIT